MLIVKNIFFPIGQGGFMYSRVENNGKKELDFIYDCGSVTTGLIDNFLDKIPLNYFDDTRNKKPLIDYLYISHFDTDHINGIKKLCELMEFKKIIYPFHEDKNYRLLNTIYQISKSDDTEIDTDILKIIYNPEENFPPITGDAILIGIKPTQEPETINRDALSSTEETTKIEAETQGYHINFLANRDWITYSFIPALPNDKKVYEKIAIEFNQQFKDIQKWITDGTVKEHKQEIREFYETHFKKTDPFNRSSLVLYSGIKTQNKYSVTSTKIIFPQAEYPSLYDCLNFFYGNFQYKCKGDITENDTYALLLTGDANLKGKKLHGYLKGLKENIKTVNLPHHGSRYNVGKKTFSDFDNIKNFLTFAGHNNQYRHPHIIAIKDAIESQPTANIIHINQFQGLFEMVVLDNVV